MLYYDLGATASYGITVSLNIIFWTYFWELEADQTGLVLAISVLIAVPCAMLLLRTVVRRMAKQDVVKYSVAIMLLGISWPYILRFMDLIPANGHPAIFVILIAQNAIFMTFFMLRIVGITSITADLTDEHEVDTGLRQEGAFYSVLAFTTKLGGAVGPIYGGFALDMVGLQEGMRPGSVDQATLDTLVLVAAAGVVPIDAARAVFHLPLFDDRRAARADSEPDCFPSAQRKRGAAIAPLLYSYIDRNLILRLHLSHQFRFRSALKVPGNHASSG